MVNTTADLSKLVLQLSKRLKTISFWGFFISNKSLELRLHYHFVTLRSGIPWSDNPISLLTINHGLSYWFLLPVLVLTRCTTSQPIYWTVWTADSSHQESGLGQWWHSIIVMLCLNVFSHLSWASYFIVNFLDCCCIQLKQQFVSWPELLSPMIIISI